MARSDIAVLVVCACLLCSVGGLVVGSGKHQGTTYNWQSEITEQQVRWAITAYTYIHTLRCAEAFFTSEEECRNLVKTPRRDMVIHLAEPQARGRYLAALPDAGLARTGAHDAVIAVDPFPEANFGHLVVVFYIDLASTRLWCEREGGKFLEGGDCMILAVKKRCRNSLERRGSRRRNAARRCEINFIPRVYLESDSSHHQKLKCRPFLGGFGACPQLRPENQGSLTACDPLAENSMRCETSQEVVHTSCRAFEICDQAVLLSGGWDRHSSLPRHLENVENIYRMLRSHGFKRRNTEVFFADGLSDGLEVLGEPPHEVHSSSAKLPLRFHLQTMCSSMHCVDTLVLYLNSPARNDGAILLWDADSDGIASERETYRQEELLSDLANCEARRVHVIADQSYAGDLARAVKRSPHHRNVAVFASSREHEYSWGSDFTDLWASTNHTHQCAQDVHQATRRHPMKSTPETEQGDLVEDTTIFGAPCDVIPPFTHKELRHDFLGCQNLPTALWVKKYWTQRAPVDGSTTPGPDWRALDEIGD